MGSLRPLPRGLEVLVRSIRDPHSFQLVTTEGPASNLPRGPLNCALLRWGLLRGPGGHCLWSRRLLVRFTSSLHAVLAPLTCWVQAPGPPSGDLLYTAGLYVYKVLATPHSTVVPCLFFRPNDYMEHMHNTIRATSTTTALAQYKHNTSWVQSH